MALLNDKFTEVKGLIHQGKIPLNGAQDECDNGINNICSQAITDFVNIKGKLADAGVGEELLSEYQAVVDTYFAQP